MSKALTIPYRVTSLQWVSRTYSSCMTATFYPLTSNSLLPPSPNPWQELSASMSLTILDTSLCVESCSICPPVIGLFHLAKCPIGSSMLIHTAGFFPVSHGSLKSLCRNSSLLIQVSFPFSKILSTPITL